jgi:hypothetical protein
MFNRELENTLNEKRLLEVAPDTSQGMAILFEPMGHAAGIFTVAFCKEWLVTNPAWSYDEVPR